MATNIVHEHGDQLPVTVSNPDSPSSDNPVLVGALPGVALTDEDTDGTTSVKFNGTANLMVTDTGGGITIGTILTYNTGTDTLSDAAEDGTHIRFGYALEAVDTSATSEILVKIGY